MQRTDTNASKCGLLSLRLLQGRGRLLKLLLPARLLLHPWQGRSALGRSSRRTRWQRQRGRRGPVGVGRARLDGYVCDLRGDPRRSVLGHASHRNDPDVAPDGRQRLGRVERIASDSPSSWTVPVRHTLRWQPRSFPSTTRLGSPVQRNRWGGTPRISPAIRRRQRH